MLKPKRLALVVGNSAYQSAAPLRNAANDARAVGRKLASLGFEIMGGPGGGREVNVGIDLDRKTSVQRFAAFIDRISPGDDVLIFYAGHGLQIADQNYLVPVDASLAGDEPLAQLMRMRVMIEQAAHKAGRNGVTLVFIDACRDSPFSQEQLENVAQNARTALAGARSLPAVGLIGKGFATMKMQAREDASPTFISFATAPGDVAYDGEGDNSPFTTAVLDHMTTRGLPLDDFIDRVARDVLLKSERAKRFQDPWYESNLRHNFYFKPATLAPVIWLSITGIVVGLITTFLLLYFDAFREALGGAAAKSHPVVYGTGALFALMIGLSVMFWGSGKVRHALFVMLVATLAFAGAVFVLQTPILQTDPATATIRGDQQFSVQSFLDRARLQNFLAKSGTVTLSVLVLLAGLIFTTLASASLKVQGGGFRGFGTMMGSMIVGVLLPFMVVGLVWLLELTGPWGRAHIFELTLLTGALWFTILGAQLGYCFMFHVPDYKPDTRR